MSSTPDQDGFYAAAISLVPHESHFPGSLADIQELSTSRFVCTPVKDIVKVLKFHAGCSNALASSAVQFHMRREYPNSESVDPRLNPPAYAIQNITTVLKQQEQKEQGTFGMEMGRKVAEALENV